VDLSAGLHGSYAGRVSPPEPTTYRNDPASGAADERLLRRLAAEPGISRSGWMFGGRARLVLDHDLQHRRGSLGGLLVVFPDRGWRNTLGELARPRRVGPLVPTANRLVTTVLGMCAGIGAGSALEVVDPGMLVAPLIGMAAGATGGFWLLSIVHWRLRNRSFEVDLEGPNGHAIAELLIAALETQALVTSQAVALIDRPEITATLALGIETAARAAAISGVRGAHAARTIHRATEGVDRIRERLHGATAWTDSDPIDVFAEAVDRLLPPDVGEGVATESLFELDELAGLPFEAPGHGVINEGTATPNVEGDH
jgi:hypothetical protein